MPDWTIEVTSQPYTDQPGLVDVAERLTIELASDTEVETTATALHAGAFAATFDATAETEEEARALGCQVFLEALKAALNPLLYPEDSAGRTVVTPLPPAIGSVKVRPVR